MKKYLNHTLGLVRVLGGVCPMKALFSGFFFSGQASSHLSFGCGENTPKMRINNGGEEHNPRCESMVV
jgi:hypothetical protein